mgnify:CR=1 FL=1
MMVRSYELGILLTPACEAAYRASRWHGFSCTSTQPLPAEGGCGEAAAGAAAAAAGGAAPASAVRFTQWRRGAPQEAAAAADGVLRVPLPIAYRLPPAQYPPGERPWTVDGAWQGLDALGFDRDASPSCHYGALEHMEWGEVVERARRRSG